MPNITMQFDGRYPVTVDEEEFRIIELMVQEACVEEPIYGKTKVIKDLISQGYTKYRAMELVVLAGRSLR